MLIPEAALLPERGTQRAGKTEMSIRIPIEPAAVDADGVIDSVPAAPRRHEATFASSIVDLFVAETNPIRVAVLPPASHVAGVQKRIPGQVYH